MLIESDEVDVDSQT